MSRRLLLINPVNPRRAGLTIDQRSRFPPLGLGIIAAVTPSEWDVEIADENFEPFDYREADLVGLTAFTAAITRAYDIAALYRQRGIPTVLGGIHASMLPDEALQYVDTVVIGEAESVWGKVIADYEEGKLQRTYTADYADLKGMPKPRYDLYHSDYMIGSIQTARGCPMDCEFCSVTAFNGRRYRQRPVEEVLDELEAIPQRMVFFVDDNIIGYGKRAAERAVTLFKGIIERGIRKDWYCQASLNFADNEDVLKYAARSGCRMVFLGVESEDTNALEEVNKQLNLKLTVDKYEEVFRRINRRGIAVMGAFIYGMDGDTQQTIRHRASYILRSGVDVMQTTYLTPLPGTRLFGKLQEEKRLLYIDFPRDWDRYNMMEVTHRPQSMTPEELADAMSESSRRLYNRWSILRKLAKTWYATRSFTTAMWAYNSNMVYRNVSIASR